MNQKARPLIVLLILFCFFLPLDIVSAQQLQFTIEGFFRTITDILKDWASALALLALAVCFLIIAVSAGDPQRLAGAQRNLIYVFIGLLIIFGVAGVQIPMEGRLVDKIGWVAGKVSWMVIGAGALFFVYGIFKLAVSGGDPQEINDAKKTLLWSIVGITLASTFPSAFQAITQATTFKFVFIRLSEILGVGSMVVGVGLFIIGIAKIAFSGGNPKMLEEAQNNIVWAAIAVAIGFALYSQANDIYNLITTGRW